MDGTDQKRRITDPRVHRTICPVCAQDGIEHEIAARIEPHRERELKPVIQIPGLALQLH